MFPGNSLNFRGFLVERDFSNVRSRCTKSSGIFSMSCQNPMNKPERDIFNVRSLCTNPSRIFLMKGMRLKQKILGDYSGHLHWSSCGGLLTLVSGHLMGAPGLAIWLGAYSLKICQTYRKCLHREMNCTSRIFQCLCCHFDKC